MRIAQCLPLVARLAARGITARSPNVRLPDAAPLFDSKDNVCRHGNSPPTSCSGYINWNIQPEPSARDGTSRSQRGCSCRRPPLDLTSRLLQLRSCLFTGGRRCSRFSDSSNHLLLAALRSTVALAFGTSSSFNNFTELIGGSTASCP